MTAAEIRELTDAEIRGRVAEIQEELFRLRFRSATQQLESTALLGTLRKDVARLKTILRQRELAQQNG